MILPATMRAVVLTGHGGPEVLTLREIPVPLPGPGQVLIRVAAAGVNRPDIAQRLGRYPVPADASPIPGLEVAGHVVALAKDVQGFAVGDAVCALVHGGGYAEYALADVGTTLPVPATLSLAEAAALPEVALTVEYNLFQRAKLKRGETVLIHGGSSGIGSHAIERCVAHGAHVIVTVGSDEKAEWCLWLGAEHAINYRTRDFSKITLELTRGRGVDVALDMVGGDYIARNLRCLADDGRCAVISLQGGREAKVDFEPLLRRRLVLTGSTLRPLPRPRKAALAATVRRKVWPLVDSGHVRPRVTGQFALDDVAQAHAALEAADHTGKTVLVC